MYKDSFTCVSEFMKKLCLPEKISREDSGRVFYLEDNQQNKMSDTHTSEFKALQQTKNNWVGVMLIS